jgi:hypothetical protein
MNTNTTTATTTPKAYNFAIKIWGACWDGQGIWLDFATEEEARIALRGEIYSFLRSTSEYAPAKRTIDFIVRGKKVLTRISLDRVNHTYTIREEPDYGWD